LQHRIAVIYGDLRGRGNGWPDIGIEFAIRVIIAGKNKEYGNDEKNPVKYFLHENKLITARYYGI